MGLEVLEFEKESLKPDGLDIGRTGFKPTPWKPFKISTYFVFKESKSKLKVLLKSKNWPSVIFFPKFFECFYKNHELSISSCFLKL